MCRPEYICQKVMYMFCRTWIIFLHCVKINIRIWGEQQWMSWMPFFKFEVRYSLRLFNTSDIYNDKMSKLFFMIRNLSTPQKQWNVCLNIWKSYNHRKTEICKPKIQQEKQAPIKQLFKRT